MKKSQFPADDAGRFPRSHPSSKGVDGGLPHMRSLVLRSILGLTAALALLLLPSIAAGAPKGKGNEKVQPPVETSEGSLEQLPGRLGCLATGKTSLKLCGKARALKGAGPFMGSRAIAISRDGRNVYVAAGKSNAIAIFSRDRKTGALTQARGKKGCVAAKAAEGCGLALGMIAPNSIAVSPDGRNVYATARDSASVITFLRNRKTGALRELPPSASGCISGLPFPGCTAGRALKGPDVVVVSPDGKNVYVGDFFGNAVASFARSKFSGALTQPAGTAGCIADATEGCATGVELGSIEGLAVNRAGTAVYAAAAVSNAVDVLQRDRSTGALSQGTGTSGCITNAVVTGCALGYELAGANAVAVSPKGVGVYATSLFSNSVTTFHPVKGSVGLSQPPGPEREVEGEMVPAPEGTAGPDGCTVFLRSPGCAFGVALKAPEGIDVSPDGTNVYVAAYESGAIEVFDRTRQGIVAQKPGERGCVAPAKVQGCTLGRALSGVSSVVVSPDGRNVYSTAENSNAVDVFRRIG